MMSLHLTPIPGIPLIHAGDDLAEIIWTALKETENILEDGDILVIAQKVVSKAEGRAVRLSTIVPRSTAYELAASTGKDPRVVELILQESKEILRSRVGAIIVEHRLGFVCANAGIDHSNVAGDEGSKDEVVLLLPENPDASANQLRCRLETLSGAKIGVLIIDSHGRAWRLGTVGVAIGISGLPGLVDLRGQLDLFDWRLQITEVGAGDELAAAASLMMGQAAEGTPVVHVRGFPYALRDASLSELLRPKEQDLFR
jgi:coenzyme F420-0:L-glutamate ligase / coenzyme F420-1:gamma-L-glutamate ligase